MTYDWNPVVTYILETLSNIYLETLQKYSAETKDIWLAAFGLKPNA